MSNDKYQNGKIYKIVDVGYNKCYIGSTCEKLSARMARHRSKYQSYLNGKKLETTSFRLFDAFGVENCKIELIENFPCNNIEELHKREGYYIENTECINRCIAGRTKEQWTIDKKRTYSKTKTRMAGKKQREIKTIRENI